MFRRLLARLGFIHATVLWSMLLYGALSVSLEPRIGTPLVIGILLVLVVVAVVARLLIRRVF